MMVLSSCVTKVGEQYFVIYFNACKNIELYSSDFPKDWSGLRAID